MKRLFAIALLLGVCFATPSNREIYLRIGYHVECVRIGLHPERSFQAIKGIANESSIDPYVASSLQLVTNFLINISVYDISAGICVMLQNSNKQAELGDYEMGELLALQELYIQQEGAKIGFVVPVSQMFMVRCRFVKSGTNMRKDEMERLMMIVLNDKMVFSRFSRDTYQDLFSWVERYKEIISSYEGGRISGS